MSFMYNPFPYDDPNAINEIAVGKDISDTICFGLQDCSAMLAKRIQETLAEKRTCVLSLDGYTSAPFGVLALQVARLLLQENIAITNSETNNLYLEESELDARLSDNLPQDRTMDPPLLYGKLYANGYEGLMDTAKVTAKIQRILAFKDSGEGVYILSGNGALCDALVELSDIRCYLDLTQKRTVLNIKQAKTKNLGYTSPKPYKETLRHAYYVDFEVAAALRGKLIASRQLDYYLAADDINSIQLLPLASYIAICETLVRYPFRCRPVYLEGVWGGFYVKHLRNLPDTMKNCAWVFDLIPMEVSIVAKLQDKEIEFPFFGFVQTVGELLMGRTCCEKFDGYFPIRFNYDDTFHASGNMSIQCHPDSKYVKEHNNELGRQDESYYIVVAGQEAKTYCGFTETCDVEEFIDECKKSEKNGLPFDHDAYVHSEASKPGMQFLIPAGTIHASGRNQVILEIGSLTIGSYTYKMYDYVRKDLDGNPRPIHSIQGDAVLKRERKAAWVRKNLIQEPRIVRESPEGKEITVGEHDLLYFTLRNLCFSSRMTDDTKDRFHVLVLVEGEKVLIRSLENPDKFYVQNYMDMIVVPSSFGKYELINQGVGKIIIHKTMLRDGYEHIER
ncbi:phosphomannose isomerase [Sphaerochaeta pleomorpha str. Grapes]|uniref:Phosphomannose isomerase n=1 Tax=Sphaerochaeta pleomorpha (strain ATCC BAA-1885 / DSM 22778 / Grapes) TaxID=158190 RepID=G8QWA4_SPHPG|nr:class I mannose-6-phosphate isomerase [Sphaerochaeta pleomorpha]AEV29402.1 phosphomannose isomerase [Sphaerochaeta pleomorpha str. Grapes]